MLTYTTGIKRFYWWNECFVFFFLGKSFISAVWITACLQITGLINVIIQLSEALCFSLSRFHLQTLITGWIGSTFWETKQGRSVQNAKRCPGSSQKHRDHWDPVVWGMAKAILSFHWFNFSRRDHSLLPFIHHWQVLAGCTTHQTPSLRQRREDRFLSRSRGGGLNALQTNSWHWRWSKLMSRSLPWHEQKHWGQGTWIQIPETSEKSCVAPAKECNLAVSLFLCQIVTEIKPQHEAKPALILDF